MIFGSFPLTLSARLTRGFLIAAVLASLASGGLFRAHAEERSEQPGESLLSFAPKNLARQHLGAGVQLEGERGTLGPVALSRGNVDSNESFEALVAEDATIGVPIEAGRTSFIVSLPEVEMLQSLTFVSSQIEGSVAVETSVARGIKGSAAWRASGDAAVQAANRSVRVQLGYVDAKYLRVTIDARNPGRLYGFGVFGESILDDYGLVKAPEGDGAAISTLDAVDLNLAGGLTGARVRALSGGMETAQGSPMIDGDSTTAVALSVKAGSPAYAVLDLQDAYLIDRAAALYTGFKGDVRVYVLPELPERLDDPSAAAEALRDLKPAGDASDQIGLGIAGIDFEPRAGRYVIFEFEGADPEALEALSVSELNVFSSQNIGGLRVAGLANGGGASYGKAPVYGKQPVGKEPVYGKEAVYDKAPIVDVQEPGMNDELDMWHRYFREGFWMGGAGVSSRVFSFRDPEQPDEPREPPSEVPDDRDRPPPIIEISL